MAALLESVLLLLDGAAIAALVAANYRLRRAMRQRVIAGQQRAEYLELLNEVSKRAISSQDANQMLTEIVGEIHRRLSLDHVAIGVIDYQTNEIVIKAEAGIGSSIGRRLPLDPRLNSGQTGLEGEAGRLLSLLPDAGSVMCIPLRYGDSLLGVFNVESRRENAFAPDEVLAFHTLADLLATALHNALVFQKIQQQSITDSLTGLKTRRFFMEALNAEWKRASRNGRPFSVVMVDMDRFKDVNDTAGHLEGDMVLARVGRLLEQKCRHSNVVARYGGDEFVILMPETAVEQAEVTAERLRIWLQGDPMLGQRRITGSFGLATFPAHGATAEQVLRVADAGMYVSKHAGGNRVSTAEQISEPEAAVLQKQLLTAYVQGFLQREQTGPESVAELIATLKRLGAANDHLDALKDAIVTLSHAAETRELHSAGHGEFASRHVVAIARRLGLPADETDRLAYAARVHDVGKILIPERLLCKSGPLSAEEQALMRQHAVVGAQIVAAIPDADVVVAAVRHHHERLDGSGYPDALRGDAIPLGARILAVADAFTDMITERPYARALAPLEALAHLEARSGTQFDAGVVAHFRATLQMPPAASTD